MLKIDGSPQGKAEYAHWKVGEPKAEHLNGQKFTVLSGEENRKASEASSALIAADLWEHGRLQSQFDLALGRKYDAKDMLQRSYNPVTDRWRIEKLRRSGDEIGERAYLQEIRTNIRTNLQERLQVAENTIHYRIEGNELVSEDFPNESFSQVLARGAEYRNQHGSEETEREGWHGEQAGWEKIRQKFTDPETAIGTKITVFSPPGMVEESAYDRQILDEYELVQGETGKEVKLTRRIVDWDEADYYSAALSLDPTFFDNYDNRPMDAWYLSHPVEGVVDDIKVKGMAASTFDRVWESKILQGIVDEYTREISAQNPNWRRIARLVNAIYNQVDKEEQSALTGTSIEIPLFVSPEAVTTAISTLGWQTPRERGGAGCPTSKGYSMSNGSSYWSGNSVSEYSKQNGGPMSSNESCPEIKCGGEDCSWKANESEANAVQEGRLKACPRCGWKPK